MTLGPDGVPIDGLPLVHTVQPQDVALPIGGEGVVLLLRPLPRPLPRPQTNQRGQDVHHMHQALVPVNKRRSFFA